MCCKSISWIELYASKIIHIKLFILVYLIVIIVFFFRKIFVKIPVSAVQPFSSSDSSNIDTWEWWNQLRVLCQHHASLSPVLCLTADLPPPALLERYVCVCVCV